MIFGKDDSKIKGAIGIRLRPLRPEFSSVSKISKFFLKLTGHIDKGTAKRAAEAAYLKENTEKIFRVPYTEKSADLLQKLESKGVIEIYHCWTNYHEIQSIQRYLIS